MSENSQEGVGFEGVGYKNPEYADLVQSIIKNTSKEPDRVEGTLEYYKLAPEPLQGQSEETSGSRHNTVVIYCKDTQMIKKMQETAPNKWSVVILDSDSTTTIEEHLNPGEGLYKGKKEIHNSIESKITLQGTFKHAELISGTVETSQWIWAGNLFQGQFDGEGRLTWSNGLLEEGVWSKGLKNGRVRVFDYQKGGKMVGEATWVDGAREGEGWTVDRSGGLWKGTWEGGELKKGSVHKTWVGNENEWKRSTFVFEEVTTRPNTTKNTSNSAQNLQNGQNLGLGEGAQIDLSGRPKDQKYFEVYNGMLKNFKYDGKGTLTDQFGTKFSGFFKNGLKHGVGEETYIDGEKYSGMFEKNLPNGQGSLICFNGDKYKGGFKNGLFHGKGQYLTKEGGKVVNGEWIHGVFQTEEEYDPYDVVQAKERRNRSGRRIMKSGNTITDSRGSNLRKFDSGGLFGGGYVLGEGLGEGVAGGVVGLNRAVFLADLAMEMRVRAIDNTRKWIDLDLGKRRLLLSKCLCRSKRLRVGLRKLIFRK